MAEFDEVPGPVTVLGLGRLGSSMADRLAAEGWAVTGWSRSGRSSSGRTAATSVEAVRAGGPVLLSLFDGPACLAVLRGCQQALAPNTLVVNTSTVSPADADLAAGLVADAGSNYVHAPVLGSVPTVAAGRLVALVGGSPADVSRATPVLEALCREVRHVGSPSRAAALKLVANLSLAGVVRVLDEVLDQAMAMDLDLGTTLDVLAVGHLGRLVEAKRGWLEGTDRGIAHFTVEALAKDVRLAEEASGLPSCIGTWISRAMMSDGRRNDDIAALALPKPVT